MRRGGMHIAVACWAVVGCANDVAGPSAKIVPFDDTSIRCSLRRDASGSSLLACADGTTATIAPGGNLDGQYCDVVDDGSNLPPVRCTGPMEAESVSTPTEWVRPETQGGDIRINSPIDLAYLADVTLVTGSLSIWARQINQLALPSLRYVAGGVALSSDEAMDRFSVAVTAIGGRLYVEDVGPLTPLSFPHLKTIGGDLTFGEHDFGNRSITFIAVPKLESIGGGVLLWGNEALTGVVLPELMSVGEGWEVENQFALKELDIPKLNRVGGHLYIRGNRFLESVTLPALDRVGDDLIIQDNSALESVRLTVSTVSGSLSIGGNAALANIQMPNLTLVGGGLQVADAFPLSNAATSFDQATTNVSLPELIEVGGSLSFARNPALVSFSIPFLTSVGGSLEIDTHGNLTGFFLPALTSIGNSVHIIANALLSDFDLTNLSSTVLNFYVTANPSLCQNDVAALASRITVTEIVYTAGNNGGC